MIRAGWRPSRWHRERRWSRATFVAGLLMLPLAVLAQQLAFQLPDVVESTYSRGLYPPVARMLGWTNAWVPLSVAEALVAATVAWMVWRLVRRRRREIDQLRPPLRQRWLTAGGRLAVRIWIIAGWGFLAFLLLWGFNYARPPLADRLGLETSDLEAREVVELARRAVAAANDDHRRLGVAVDTPSRMPMTLLELNRVVDARFRDLRLPGDELGDLSSRAKPLLSSTLLSYLGISGIYIPFTGEPSFNRLVPDASLPITVAHEKAHQRGITDEGEANLAAAVACAGADDDYLRYAAHLYMATVLVGGAARYASDQAAEVWADLEAGPSADIDAIREFWNGYRGRATRVATRVNDAYLRSNRVPGGVQSYGRVVRLLVGLSRRGEVLAEVPR